MKSGEIIARKQRIWFLGATYQLMHILLRWNFDFHAPVRRWISVRIIHLNIEFCVRKILIKIDKFLRKKKVIVFLESKR